MRDFGREPQFLICCPMEGLDISSACESHIDVGVASLFSAVAFLMLDISDRRFAHKTVREREVSDEQPRV